VSRNPDDYTDERRTAVALERIADTLDDYMEMSLAAQEIMQELQLAGAKGDERWEMVRDALAPLFNTIGSIRERRAKR
jgi:hypothetical protein